MSSSILHDHIIPSCFLINLSFAFLLVFLVVSVLFIFSLLGKTYSQPKPRSVSSWVILLTLIATSSLLMSLSLRIFPSPLQRVLLFRMSYLFLSCLTISRFPFTYGCCDSTTSGLYSPSSSSYRASSSLIFYATIISCFDSTTAR